MSERQTTPDLLGKLMSGTTAKEEKGDAISIARNKAIKPERNKSIKPADANESPTQTITSILSLHTDDVPKEKATFNLSIQILEELEDKWMELRRMSGSKQISKTLIVETSLEMALEEFDKRKQESKFYSKLVDNKAIKQ